MILKIGQQYLRQRYYAAAGRFNQLDPFFGNLNDPQSLHKYLYIHADLVNVIDLSGMFSVDGMIGAIGIGMTIGTGAGGVYGSMRYGIGLVGISVR